MYSFGKLYTPDQVSAKNKSRLKFFVFVHWMLGGVHILRLLPADMLPLPPTPPPVQLEYLWLASLPFTLIAMSACRKSKVGGLNVFQFGLTGSGICVLLMTLFFNMPETTQFLLTGSIKGTRQLKKVLKLRTFAGLTPHPPSEENMYSSWTFFPQKSNIANDL